MSEGPGSNPVTVVVPVYGDPQVTRDCLTSLATSTLPEDARVIVIDDHSPDTELVESCEDICREAGFELIRNDENLGFVGTANRGLQISDPSDVILLNSDTQVCNDWVQRLRACAYRDSRIGTVTPFSNNGTICSYPVILQENDLPPDWTCGELDALFHKANEAMWQEIPTAVGFCMYIKRACLEQVGHFDQVNFGAGYGEECDFSRRAVQRGWINAIAADVFVYHRGGASFAARSEERKRKADQVMSELHPDYDGLVTAFLQEDPLHDLRSRSDVARLQSGKNDVRVLLEEHRRHSRSLLDRNQEVLKSLLHEQAQNEKLDKLLDDCRSQFESTDVALQQAQKLVEEQRDYIADLNRHIKGLDEHISNMEQSRSWRYTRFLRREH